MSLVVGLIGFGYSAEVFHFPFLQKPPFDLKYISFRMVKNAKAIEWCPNAIFLPTEELLLLLI